MGREPANEGSIKRIPFFDIFRMNADGSLTPLRTINVNDVVFGTGVAFGPGVRIGGVDFFRFLGFDIAAREENGILILKGFYERKSSEKAAR